MSLQEKNLRSQGLAKVLGSVLGASTFIFAAALFYSVLDAVFIRLIFLEARFSDYGVMTYFYRSYVLYAVFLAAAARYVSHVDIAPSVVDALGLATDAVFDGGSFLAASRSGSEAVYAEHVKRGNEKKAVRSEGWLLISDSITGVRELYDLTSDPGAQENLAGKGLAQEELLGRELASYVKATEEAAKAMGAPPEMNLPEDRKRRLQGLGYIGP